MFFIARTREPTGGKADPPSSLGLLVAATELDSAIGALAGPITRSCRESWLTLTEVRTAGSLGLKGGVGDT